MSQLRFTREAEADLNDIWDYIAADSIQAADSFTGKLEKACFALADQPHMGRARTELAPELRYFPVDHYLIFYRPSENSVQIIRIVRASRDVDHLFPSEDGY